MDIRLHICPALGVILGAFIVCRNPPVTPGIIQAHLQPLFPHRLAVFPHKITPWRLLCTAVIRGCRIPQTITVMVPCSKTSIFKTSLLKHFRKSLRIKKRRIPFLCHLFITRTQAPPNQCNRRCLQAVSERKRKSHDVHAYLMCRHGIRALLRSHHRRHHKPNPHQNLFKENTVPYMDQIAQRPGGRPNLILHNIGNVDKAIRF